MKEKGTRDLVEKYNERLAEEKVSAEQSLKREQAAHAEVSIAFSSISPSQSLPTCGVPFHLVAYLSILWRAGFDKGTHSGSL
jgi:hypothetical protein